MKLTIDGGKTEHEITWIQRDWPDSTTQDVMFADGTLGSIMESGDGWFVLYKGPDAESWEGPGPMRIFDR